MSLVILCYHRVLPDSPTFWPYFTRGTAVSISTFRAHIDSLARRCRIIDESHAAAYLCGQTLPEATGAPLCWITFDDGYRDNIEYAAPVLAEHCIRPTLFITTRILRDSDWLLPVDAWYAAIIGATRPQGVLQGFGVAPWRFDLHDPDHRARLIKGPEKRAYVLADSDRKQVLLDCLRQALEPAGETRPAYLDGRDLTTLAHLGWRVGSHSCTHRLLPGCADHELDHEVCDSIADLANLGDARSSFFAYPDGAWNPATRDAVARRCRARGVLGGLTIDRGHARPGADLFALPRLLAGHDLTNHDLD
jgi:peptidoglycan/xylan/chitin deacetylase (PgdA/CDA1 family)